MITQCPLNHRRRAVERRLRWVSIQTRLLLIPQRFPRRVHRDAPHPVNSQLQPDDAMFRPVQRQMHRLPPRLGRLHPLLPDQPAIQKAPRCIGDRSPRKPGNLLQTGARDRSMLPNRSQNVQYADSRHCLNLPALEPPVAVRAGPFSRLCGKLFKASDALKWRLTANKARQCNFLRVCKSIRPITQNRADLSRMVQLNRFGRVYPALLRRCLGIDASTREAELGIPSNPITSRSTMPRRLSRGIVGMFVPIAI